MSDIAGQYRDSARSYVKENGRHTPTKLYEVLGPPPDGFRLKADGRGSVSIENRVNRRGRRTRANELRIRRAESKGIFEDSDFRSKSRQAQRLSSSTLHQLVSDGKPTIVEHDVALQNGGSNGYTSLSDPYFKQFKDDAESKIYSKFGKENVVVDIDDISGGVRSIPASNHNKFQPTSQQPGVTFEPGQEIDLAKVEAILDKHNNRQSSDTVAVKKNQLSALRNTARAATVAGVVGIGAFGTAASAAETDARLKIASKTGNPIDQLQAAISGISLAADGVSYIPPATIPASIVSTGADLVNGSIDTARDSKSTVQQGLDILSKFYQNGRKAVEANGISTI